MAPALDLLGLTESSHATTLAIGAAVAAAATAAVVVASMGDGNKTKTDPQFTPRTIHSPASTLPVLGNMLDALGNTHRSHDWFKDYSIAFDGEPWRLRILGQPDQIVLTSPEAIEEVTIKQFEKFPKGPTQTDLTSTLFGRGMLSSDGERWYHQRKTAAKFFSAKVLRTFLTKAVHKSVTRMTALFDEAIQEGKAVNLKKLFHDFTLDTFVEMALGVDLNCVSSKEPHKFQVALDTASPVMSLRFHRPGFYWKFEHWLGVGREGEMKRNVAVMHAWLNEVIQQSIDACISRGSIGGEATEETVKTVVELFIQSSEDGMEGLQKEDLVDFVLTFVIAARDTTADTLTWFFYLMQHNPHVQAKLRSEMMTALADVEEGTFLTPDHARHMIYLEACIKETLRLYPAAPYTYREATEDTVLCGDIVVKKGENTGLAIYAMGRLPKLWGPDAEEFKPERFIDEATGKIKQFSATQFFAFSAGPRACIGMNLAMMELRVVIINLFFRYNFDVDVVANKGEYELSPTLTMKNPLMARPSHASR